MPIFLVSETVIDLAFLLEGSKQLTSAQFEALKTFVKSSIDNIHVSESGSHVAVMEYSDEATLKISFNDFTNPDRLKEAVDRIQPSRGQGVETAKGLELAANRVFGVGHGSRPGVAKVLVLLTASNSTGVERLRYAAMPLVYRGVTVYVVGIGKNVDQDEVKELVADKGMVVSVNVVNELPRVVPNVLKKIISVVEKGKYNATQCNAVYCSVV